MDKRWIALGIEEIGNRIQQFSCANGWLVTEINTAGDGSTRLSINRVTEEEARLQQSRSRLSPGINTDTVEIACWPEGAQLTRVAINWHTAAKTLRGAISAGLLAWIVFGCLLSHFREIFDVQSLEQGISKGFVVGFAITLVVFLYLCSSVGVSAWLLREEQNRIWKAIGWDSITGRLLQGELDAGQSSTLRIIWRLVLVILLLQFYSLIGVPDLYWYVLLAFAVLEITVELWRTVPLLYWKARLLQTVSLQTSYFALILYYVHCIILLFAVVAGDAIDKRIASNHNRGINVIAQGDSFALFTESTSRNVFDINISAEPDTIMPTVYRNLSNLGLSEYDTSKFGYGTIFLNAVPYVNPSISSYEVRRYYARAYLYVVLSIAVCGQVVRIWSFARAPAGWRKRYRDTLRASNLLRGVRIASLRKHERILFAIWVVINWLVSLLFVSFALWLGWMSTNWLLFGVESPGLRARLEIPWTFDGHAACAGLFRMYGRSWSGDGAR